MKPLKTLQLRSSGQLLGAERVVLELCAKLPAHAIESIIVVPHEKAEPEPEFASVARKLGFTVEIIPISGAFDFSAIKKLKQIISDYNIDLIHTHGYREDFYAISCKRSAKLVATNHLWKRTDFRLRLYAFFDALILRFFDHITAVSKPVLQDMLDARLHKNNMTVVPNGIDLNAYGDISQREAVRKELGVPLQAKVIATLSSLTIEKGIEYAIRALPNIIEEEPDACLLIIGDGELRESLTLKALELGVTKQVFFAGRRADVPKVLACLDVFLLPSLAEGLPMALLEAMATGLPVVATDVGDVADVVDTQVGCLIEPQNTEAIQRAVNALLASSTEAQKKGKAARERIKTHFSADAMATHYARIYRDVVDA